MRKADLTLTPPNISDLASGWPENDRQWPLSGWAYLLQPIFGTVWPPFQPPATVLTDSFGGGEKRDEGLFRLVGKNLQFSLKTSSLRYPKICQVFVNSNFGWKLKFKKKVNNDMTSECLDLNISFLDLEISSMGLLIFMNPCYLFFMNPYC